MVGALSYQAARSPKLRGVPALGRYARRYADGGEVDDSTGGTPPIGGSYVPMDENVLSDATAPRGPLAQVAGQGPAPEVADRIAALRNARSILAAGNGHRPLSAAVTPNLPLPVPPMPPDQIPPPDQSPGPPLSPSPSPPSGPNAGPPGNNNTVNMPLLMAAAGMLKGGHPGGFSQDLGYAMEEGGNALEKQRQLEENARLRAAQQANTAAYQQGVLAVRGQHEDNYAVTAQARAAELQAQASHLMARAMGGMAGRVSEAQLEQQAIDEAMKGDNTRMLLLQQARTTQAAAMNAQTKQNRVDKLNDQRQWMRTNRVTDAEMREALALKQQSEKLDLVGKPIGTPLTPDQALAEVRRLRGTNAQPPAATARPPAAAPASGALPLPASQGDLVTGKIYNTSRGPATWNGSGFTTTPTGQ